LPEEKDKMQESAASIGNETYSSERYEGQDNSYNTILMRLDPTPTLEDIKRYLLKETLYNEKIEKYERPPGLKPMFDEEGVQELIMELRARMSIDKVLSINTQNEIRLITREVGEVILEFLWFNSEKFSINEGDFSRIFYMIKHNIEIFLRRTLQGQENKLLAAGLTHREVVNKNQSQEVKEGTSRDTGFNFFNKGGRF
jgi:hypothetical protein